MTHPLDQITSEEINKAVDLCKSHQDFCEETVFLSISLVEPDKELLRKGSDVELSRKLKIRGIDSNSDGGFESILDITNNQIISLDRVSNDAQVTYSMAEVFMAQELTKANKDYQEALEKRGITDLELIQIDPWPAGGIVHETIEPGHRAFKTISFLKEISQIMHTLNQ